MDGATGRAALTTKDIDALWGGYELLQLQQQGLARIIYSTQGQAADLTRATHILVTESFEQKYPEILQRVVNVFVREAAWTTDPSNREKVLEHWTKSGVPYAVWRQDYEAFPLAERLSPIFDEYITQHYHNALAGALKFKLVRGAFDIEEKYVNQALSDLNLKNRWPSYDTKGQVIKVVTGS
jgi:sulfonate transport system substrate-binding protein